MYVYMYMYLYMYMYRKRIYVYRKRKGESRRPAEGLLQMKAIQQMRTKTVSRLIYRVDFLFCKHRDLLSCNYYNVDRRQRYC